MSPKKKSKAKKKALADEKKAQMEEKKREMRIQLVDSFLNYKLKKEVELGRINEAKLNAQWRALLRDIKNQELEKEMTIRWHTFERTLNRKNSIIQTLMNDIRQAEIQYHRAQEGHMENVDKLLNIYMARLTDLHKDYEIQKDKLRKAFTLERQYMERSNNEGETYMKTLKYAMSQMAIDTLSNTGTEHQAAMNEIKNKNIEDASTMKIVWESAIEKLWRKFHQTLKQYQEDTEERRKAYNELKLKDERNGAIIENQMQKIQKITETIQSKKTKITELVTVHRRHLYRLRSQRDDLRSSFGELRSYSSNKRGDERGHLKELTVASNHVLKELKRVEQKGHQILKLAEICSKKELEEEKVVPFYMESLTEEEIKAIEEEEGSSTAEPLAATLQEQNKMKNFWSRYNKVLLNTAALRKEHAVLSAENSHLKCLLKHYLDGISVNPDLMQQPNTLLTVNNRVPPFYRPPERPVASVVLEGNTEIRKAASHSIKQLEPFVTASSVTACNCPTTQ